MNFNFASVKFFWSNLSGSFWKKAYLLTGAFFSRWYLAVEPVDVPFYRQQDRQGNWFKLPSGTLCFLASSNLFLELRETRWLALGNSPEARQLNGEIERFIKNGESFDAEEFIAQMKKESDDIEAAILQAEYARAGLNDEIRLAKLAKKNDDEHYNRSS